MQIALEVIPEPQPGTAAVLISDKRGPHPVMQGGGDVNYTCGACGNTLAKQVARGLLQQMVVKCPNCSEYNLFRDV